MEQTKLYEVIFKRKSVRKYDLALLDEKTLAEIAEFIDHVKPLFPEIKTKISIVGQEEVKVLLPIKAPHYLLFYSEEKEGYLTNAGYMLQQIDLFLSSNGLGSCYLGMAHPAKATKEINNGSGLEFVIAYAFGNATESVHRTDVSAFKRNALSEIFNFTQGFELSQVANLDKILEAVRIAPSASNSQPWFFTMGNTQGNTQGNNQGNVIIHAYCCKPNIIKALLYEKVNKIDMGIVFCHVGVAAKHFGNQVEFIQDQTAKANPPKGYYYNYSFKIK